jgi:hypothetical protein
MFKNNMTPQGARRSIPAWLAEYAVSSRNDIVALRDHVRARAAGMLVRILLLGIGQKQRVISQSCVGSRCRGLEIERQVPLVQKRKQEPRRRDLCGRQRPASEATAFDTEPFVPPFGRAILLRRVNVLRDAASRINSEVGRIIGSVEGCEQTPEVRDCLGTHTITDVQDQSAGIVRHSRGQRVPGCQPVSHPVGKRNPCHDESLLYD